MANEEGKQNDRPLASSYLVDVEKNVLGAELSCEVTCTKQGGGAGFWGE